MLTDKSLLETFDLVEEVDNRQAEAICGGVNEASGFCLRNLTDININYSLKTPKGSQFTDYSVSPNGGTRWHYFDNTTDLSKWTIQFDSDLREGLDYYLQYSLTPSLSKYRTCDYFQQYNFEKVAGGDFLDLYTA